MSNTDKHSVPQQPKKTSDPFHSRAVDDLVQAHTGRTRAYSEQELKKYRTRKGISLPEWLKIVLIKLWFAGMVCYFFIWGLGIYIAAPLDLLFITGLAMGTVNDLLLNSLLRFMEETPGENSRWMMFPRKHILMLPLNILYAFLILMCVYHTYVGVNSMAAAGAADSRSILLGVEPILFGILYLSFDSFFIFIKRTVLRIIREARQKVDDQMK